MPSVTFFPSLGVSIPTGCSYFEYLPCLYTGFKSFTQLWSSLQLSLNSLRWCKNVFCHSVHTPPKFSCFSRIYCTLDLYFFSVVATSYMCLLSTWTITSTNWDCEYKTPKFQRFSKKKKKSKIYHYYVVMIFGYVGLN